MVDLLGRAEARFHLTTLKVVTRNTKQKIQRFLSLPNDNPKSYVRD